MRRQERGLSPAPVQIIASTSDTVRIAEGEPADGHHLDLDPAAAAEQLAEACHGRQAALFFALELVNELRRRR